VCVKGGKGMCIVHVHVYACLVCVLICRHTGNLLAQENLPPNLLMSDP
jgi:hypothetical protein